jgi:hypothetical protein
MASKIELSGQARRELKEAATAGKGWISGSDDIAEAELVRARLVYDGAVTGDGYAWLKS